MANQLPIATADDILNELEALVTLFTDAFPDAQIVRQNIPRNPQPDTFVIAFQSANTETETALSYVNTREWQIIYVSGTSESDSANVLRALGSAEKILVGNPRMVIPINDGSLRYMRIGGYSTSQVAELEDGNKAGLAILQTEVRKARDLPTYEKIMETGVRRG